ncbi:transcription factor cmr1 protein [Apiospora hydei]|uniref:Transcription factor cmr1 protein n=1 Tax=Apiospora hydei TaxID=1337664 RepID=A0ABR1W7E3_9PEZI
MVSFQDALAAGKITTEQAHELFDSLDAVKPSELRGLWQGSEFPTGSSSDGLLSASGWFGKRFTSDDHVDPLVFYTKKKDPAADGKGGDSSNDDGLFAADPPKATALFLQGAYVPNHQAECETQESGARLRHVEYRGVVTASMIYNQLPIIDHFRRVDDNKLLGGYG